MTRKELIHQIQKRRTFLCVGLDPAIEKFPVHLRNDKDAIFKFNKAIIDATAPYCVAYKPNAAFYECGGTHGWEQLRMTAKYIRENYPEHFLIIDAKRGDIGNTAKMYAKAFFEDMDADAVTVAPYMGEDSVKPFLGFEGKWVILLALTSNPGSMDFQMTLDADGKRLFEKVISTARIWASPDEIMFVAGATRGELLADVRAVAPDNFLLVPGVGAQGGSLMEVCKYAVTPDCGLLVNSSRGIIYASSGEDFATAAAKAAEKLRDEMALIMLGKGE